MSMNMCECVCVCECVWVCVYMCVGYSLEFWCRCEGRVREEGAEGYEMTWWPLNPLEGTWVLAEDNYVVLDKEMNINNIKFILNIW